MKQVSFVAYVASVLSVRCAVESQLHSWRSLSEVVGEVLVAIGSPSPSTDIPIASASTR